MPLALFSQRQKSNEKKNYLKICANLSTSAKTRCDVQACNFDEKLRQSERKKKHQTLHFCESLGASESEKIELQ